MTFLKNGRIIGQLNLEPDQTVLQKGKIMKFGKKKIWYLLYTIFAMHLPVSRRAKIFKKVRVFFAKRVIESCGKNVNIEKGATFTPKLKIGDYSGVGIRCEMTGDITIGKYVMMGPEVIIYTQNHAFDRTDIPMMYQGGTAEKPVIIEDDVWIGRRVIIMGGVHIGKGSVIGAGAVVTKDVEPYSVVGGVPAKLIKKRTTTNI